MNYVQKKTSYKNEFIQLLGATPEKINHNALRILKTYVTSLFNDLPLKRYGPNLFHTPIVTEIIQYPTEPEPIATVPTTNTNITEHINQNTSDVDVNNEEDKQIEEVDKNDLLCKICSVKKIEYAHNKCGHIVCEGCLLNIINNSDSEYDDITTICPYCRSRENVFVKLYL